MRKKSAAQRILAMFLTVAMVAALFPATVLVNAVSATENPILVDPITGEPVGVVSTENGSATLKPFYLVNWDRNFETNSFTNVYYMPYTWINTDKFTPDAEQINIGVYVNGGSKSNVQEAAKLLYNDFSQRPVGTRYLNLAALGSVFKHCVKDAIDFEDGIRLVSDWLDRFLTAYKALGGELDGLAIDLEYNYYTPFYIQSYFCSPYTENEVEMEPRNIDILQDIVRNERVYQTKIRPQLKELETQGLFNFWTGGSGKDTSTGKNITITIDPATGLPTNPNAAKNYTSKRPIPVSELTSINRYDDDGGNATARNGWTTVLTRHLADSINRAAFYPMLKHYPNALLSDYSRSDTYSWHKGFTTSGETTGTGAKAGNTANGVYYGSGVGDYFYDSGSKSATRQRYYKPVGQNAAVYEVDTPYSVFMREVNNHKRIVASAEEMGTEHTNVWVPYFHYASNTTSYGNTAYYSELLYHLGMTNPEPFLGYLIKSEVEKKGKQDAYKDDPNYGNFQYTLGVTNELLAELTRVAGAADRKPIVTPITWDDGFLYSGMYAGGRNIWRVTPDMTKVSVEDFKVAGKKAPTFTVNGVTITFPQGRIIADTDITQIGTSGYWVETPADVMPVITRSENYFAEHPSFGEDFEKYRPGTFNSIKESINTSLYPAAYRPDTYWTKTGAGTATIVEKNGNKTMTLTGTTTLENSAADASVKGATNLTVPALITAGDYYAQQQAWEVTATMPSKFSGTIKLLNYATTDGFKIDSTGKVSYADSGEWAGMGLTLTAGKAYTFKRILNFSTLKCDYYVLDANGKLLKSQTGKTMASVTTPVSKIYMSTTSVSGTVTIDNYKLYPVGVTANLDLYEELALSQFADYTGYVRKVTDATAARTSKTFYRVSYMNASTGYQKAILKNGKTGAVIEEVVMAPGDSGYFTGYVNATASAPVTFVLTKVSATAPTTPDYEAGDFSWPSYTDNLGICCYVVDQGYATLEAALAAAKDGQTISLLKDVQLAATALVSTNVKINSNGFTISLADGFAGDSAFQVVGGTLNWSEGVLNAGSKTAITVTAGTLNVTGGTITTTGTAILLEQNSDQDPATVKVTGGTVQGEKAFLHTNANKESSENVTATITATAVTGTVETDELHFEIQSGEGVYTLHGHTYTIIPGYAATCEKDGLTDGAEYPCCNKNLPQVVIPAVGGEHNWETAPCSTAQVCTKCGMTGVAGEANHSYDAGVVTPVTCTKDGYTTYTCSACGYSYTDNVIPAPGHTNGAAVKEKEVAETCTTDGSYDEVTYCTVCSKETSRKTVILTAPGHVPGEVEVENEVAMTCTDDGSYDNVVYCTVCLSEISRQTVIIPAPVGGHDSDGYQREVISVGTCTVDDYYIDVVYCTACGFEHSRQEFYTPAPGHKFVVGETHVTCENCDYNKEIGTATIKFQTGVKTDKDTDGTIWEPTMSIGMAPIYAKTPETGIPTTTGASATDWNIKLEWEVGGIPTLTLKDAKLINELRAAAYQTLIIGGTTDWDILLEGTNEIYGNPTGDAYDTGLSWRGGVSIYATMTGMLTIKGRSKADSLKVENVINNCITRLYGPMTIENATVLLDVKGMYYTYCGIYMAYGSDAANAGVTDLVVRNADLTILGYKYNARALTMGSKTDEVAYDETNVGDVLFQNSKIYMVRDGDYGYQTPAQTANIRTGKGANFTIDRCDVTLKGGTYVTRFIPTIINCDTTLTKEGGTEITESFSTITATHHCLAGETVIESHAPKAECVTYRDHVTYCTLCGKEMTRESESLPHSKVHTPGKKVELVDQRVNIQRETYKDSKGRNCYRYHPGKYVFEYTCSICGETWIEEQTFKPVLLKYITSGNGSANYNDKWGDNYYINSNTYNPTEHIVPGTTKYYETKDNDSANPNNTYMVPLTDPDKIAAGQWNVKIEYPHHADPVMTLKNANINNNTALWYGFAGYNDCAPLTIVLEGTNYIKQNYAVQGGGVLNLRTKNPVTITGGGSLYLESWSTAPAIRTLGSDVVFDNVNITIVRQHCSATTTRTSAIAAATNSSDVPSANVYVKNSTINYVAFGRTRYNDDGSVKDVYPGYNSLIRGVDVVIENSTIIAHGTFGAKKGILHATGDMTISESTLLLAHGYAYEKNTALNADAIVCGGTLTLNYANGITGETANVATYVDNHVDWSTITYPDESKKSAIDSIADVTAAKGNYYLQIAPTKVLAKFSGSRVGVEDDLILEFALDTSKVTDTGYALITRTRVNPDGSVSTDDPIRIDLNKVATESFGSMTCYVIPYAGIAAKEMQDRVTITVYDAEGCKVTETKTDSVYDYAVRMLRGKTPAGYTEEQFAKLKTVLVDLLSYGAMAQVQFDYNNENLANMVLNPTEWGIATQAFDKVENPAAVTVGTGYIGTAFELKSNIAMLMGIRTTQLGKGSYAMVYVGDSAEGIRVDAVDEENNIAVFTFNGLVAAKGRTNVTWKFYRAGEDATTAEPTLIVTDSMINYVSRMVEEYPYLAELMHYCDAAAAYFDTLN